MSFWDHLDVLRGLLFRVAAVWVVFSVVFFIFKDFLFNDLILAPSRSDFFVYRWLGISMNLTLINTDVTAQFMTHIKASFMGAVVVTVPYLLYEIWRFVKPALYEREKKAVGTAFFCSSFLFYIGMAVSYVMVLPLMLNFFAGYQVTDQVDNMFNLGSYMSLFYSMVLIFGLLFEMPTVVAVLSRMGLFYRRQMRNSWRYAVCGIVILAALITPTGDPFSLAVVCLPLFILYGLSFLVCKKEPKTEIAETE